MMFSVTKTVQFSSIGKTYTLMSTDGVAATIIEKSFKKMATKENLQYKVR